MLLISSFQVAEIVLRSKAKVHPPLKTPPGLKTSPLSPFKTHSSLLLPCLSSLWEEAGDGDGGGGESAPPLPLPHILTPRVHASRKYLLLSPPAVFQHLTILITLQVW